MAFGLGVLPLAVATGAGAGAQRAIGTGVFGGMLGGTFLGIFFIPLFFVVVQRLFHGVSQPAPTHTADGRQPPSGAGGGEGAYGSVYRKPAGEGRHGA